MNFITGSLLIVTSDENVLAVMLTLGLLDPVQLHREVQTA
jgi:hypothetical protein